MSKYRKPVPRDAPRRAHTTKCPCLYDPDTKISRCRDIAVCDPCYKHFVQNWTMRAGFEALASEVVYFVTLTYDDDALAAGWGGLLQSEKALKNYMLSLNRDGKKKGFKAKRLAAFELGDKTGRPHLHLILFISQVGEKWVRPDVKLQQRLLQKYWPHGSSQYELPRTKGGSIEYTLAYACKQGGHLFRPSPGLGKRGLIAYAAMLGRNGYPLIKDQFGVVVRPPNIRSQRPQSVGFLGIERPGKQRDFLLPLSSYYLPAMVEAHAEGWREYYGVDPPANPWLKWVRGDY